MALRLEVPIVVFGLAVACGGQTQRDSSTAGGGGSLGGGTSATGGYGGSGATGYGGSSGTGYGGAGGVPAGGATPGGSGGFGNFAGSPPENVLGHDCASDADCQYMKCFDPLDIGGGAPHGMCSFDCSSDASVCSVVAGASCQQLGGSSFCVGPCTLGPDGLQSFEKSKCRGRQDMACAELDDGKVGCLPNCNGDFDCPNGTVCNPKTGLCQVGTVSGAPNGAACSDSTECKGECLQGMCFEACTIGAMPSCGWSGPGSGSAAAYCVDLGAPYAYGDRAYCYALCNCDLDCGTSGVACKPLDDPKVVQATKKQGRCIATTVPYLPCK